MTTIMQTIRARINRECISRRCRNGQCRLRLDNIPQEHILINFDCLNLGITPDVPKADFIYIGSDGAVAILELKAGAFHLSEVRMQLQGSARYAEKSLLVGCKITTFHAIVVHGGRALDRSRQKRGHRKRNPHDNSETVTFEDRQYPVHLVRCGTSLIDVLRK